MLSSNASDVLAWRALVHVLIQQERTAEALEDIAEALHKQDSRPELYLLAAQIHSSLDDDDAAIEALRSFSERVNSPAGYLPLVHFYSNQHDARSTRGVLEEAISRYPAEPHLYLFYTEALLADGKLDDARAAFSARLTPLG